jgi:N6-adenosine-specific RNA methylase IME4
LAFLAKKCNLVKIKDMEMMSQEQPSTFARMVDKLRNKSEAELKMLYVQFFGNELKDEWKSITNDADFKNASEEDIIKAIQKNRYGSHNV